MPSVTLPTAQKRSVASGPPVARSVASRENASALAPTLMRNRSTLFATSKRRTTLSSPPDASVAPSGENATHVTAASPSRTHTHCPEEESHTRTEKSLLALARRVLFFSGEKHTWLTRAACAMRMRDDRIRTTSQSTTFSPLAHATSIPSGENARDAITSVWPVSACTSLPVAASHSHTTWSSPPDAIVRPSGEHATVFAGWFRSVLRTLPVATSHTRMADSLAAETISVPHAENATSCTSRVCLWITRMHGSTWQVTSCTR
mmetsp:Transcript_16307/g.38280  ORF Transcript_16307/g.38280 Transcript_16307/m.38280 type:complete len:262 (-) Transcript_16307:79-864(-)